MTEPDKPAQASMPPPLPSAGAAPTRPPGGAMPGSGGTAGQSYQGMATGSLVCAIVGIFIAQPILGTIAIVLGAVARSKMRRSNNPQGKGMALAGIIIGAVEIALTVLIVLFIIIGVATSNH